MESIWKKQTKIAEWKPLKENKGVNCNTDLSINSEMHRQIAVIGAGMAGILTAYFLKEHGADVIVMDADRIAGGQTGRTTAKITSQHGLKYSVLIRNIGWKKALMYARANEAAIREYEHIIREKQIECEFERVPAYLYTLEDEESMKREARAAASLGIKAHFTRDTELPFEVKGAVCFEDQAQFNPLAFIEKITDELEVLENTKVIDIDISKGRIITETGAVTADKIVIATHYPILNIPGFYFLRQHQERSYVLALDCCKRLNGMYYGVDKDGLSFRSVGDLLLLGGSSHRTGENVSGGAYGRLEAAADRYFSGYEEITRWSAQDCMPHDGIPFIGKYSCWSKRLYVATGFQKWGMTSSMLAAMILSDILCGRDNPYLKLFTPQRCNVRAGVKNLLTDVGQSVKGLSKGAFHRPKAGAKDLDLGHGGIVTIDGIRYACYRDEDGILHKISARCPHMGCELTWNPDEHSWDCPCHGSRFDVDGKLLDNPAKHGIENR